jgi:hypothetical protein
LLPLNIKAVLGNDFAELRGDHGGVAHVPTQDLEKGIDERLADMGFLDSGGEE